MSRCFGGGIGRRCGNVRGGSLRLFHHSGLLGRSAKLAHNGEEPLGGDQTTLCANRPAKAESPINLLPRVAHTGRLAKHKPAVFLDRYAQAQVAVGSA